MSLPAKDDQIGYRVHEAVKELNDALREANNAGLQIETEIRESRQLRDGLNMAYVSVVLMRPIKLTVNPDSPTKAKLDENLLVPRRR